VNRGRCWNILKVMRRSFATKRGTGILMMNLGGPSTQDEVLPFLTRLFSDREIMNLPFQSYLGPLISRRRAAAVAKQYAQIGGGSPIRKYTEMQGVLMTKLLDERSPETAPHKHYIAFRYAEPLTADTLKQMKHDGIYRAIAFSQYPQYSCSTAGSSLNELYRQLKNLDMIQQFRWSVIDRWPTHSGLVKTFAQLVNDGIEKFNERDRHKVVILFTAHSLPLKVVERGDSYPQEVAATVHAVMEALAFRHPYRLTWQSKVGPLPWIGPSTEHILRGLAKNEHKHILFVPIVFTSDHIETLYELDIVYAAVATKLGVTLHRARALNVEPTFIEAMSDLVIENLRSESQYSPQLRLICPHCTNQWCTLAKSYFCGNS